MLVQSLIEPKAVALARRFCHHLDYMVLHLGTGLDVNELDCALVYGRGASY